MAIHRRLVIYLAFVFLGACSSQPTKITPKPYVPEVVARAVIQNEEVVIIRAYGGFVDVGNWLELYRFPLNVTDSDKWRSMKAHYIGQIDYDDRFWERPDLNVPRNIVEVKINADRKEIHFKFDKGKDQVISLTAISSHPKQ